MAQQITLQHLHKCTSRILLNSIKLCTSSTNYSEFIQGPRVVFKNTFESGVLFSELVTPSLAFRIYTRAGNGWTQHNSPTKHPEQANQ